MPWYRCFLVNSEDLLRTPFYITPLGEMPPRFFIFTKLILRSWKTNSLKWTKQNMRYKSSLWEVFLNFGKFTEKHLLRNFFLIQQVSSCSPANLLKIGSSVFLWILLDFQKQLFYRTPVDDCFYVSYYI